VQPQLKQRCESSLIQIKISVTRDAIFEASIEGTEPLTHSSFLGSLRRVSVGSQVEAVGLNCRESFSMKRERFSAILLCAAAVAFATTVSAQNIRSKTAPARDIRTIPSPVDRAKTGLILRQDLFDRNNPNNLRSDWPAPPAQPGQL
jgi:hypothetical protein